MEVEFLSWLHSNYKKSKKSTQVFVIVGILFIAIALLCFFGFILQIVQYRIVEYEETTLSNFKICAVDNPIENGDASCGSSFPVGTLELYACGYVNADYLKPGNFVDLQIILDNDSATLALYHNSAGDHFTAGNFCHKIIIPYNSEPDLYKVTVYFSRKLVASVQFQLK